MITVGSRWETGPWRRESREIIIEDARPETGQVSFRFLDNDARSSTTITAFLRTYIEMENT